MIINKESVKENDGWVTMETLLKFKRLADLSSDAKTILASIKKSDSGRTNWDDIRYFPKGLYLSNIFPSGNFPIVQFSKRLLPMSVVAAELGPIACPAAKLASNFSLQRIRRPNLTFVKLLLRKFHILEAVTLEIVTEVALGKIPLGKYLTPPSMQSSFHLSVKISSTYWQII